MTTSTPSSRRIASNPRTDGLCPWPEDKDGITIVIEPKPHWASDMRAFRSDVREYCAYADWAEHGARARFFGHIAICGDDLIRKARALIACEIAEGQWNRNSNDYAIGHTHDLLTASF